LDEGLVSYHNSLIASCWLIPGAFIVYSIFSETDPAEHARIKKPIAKYFSSAGVAPLEPHVDDSVALLCKQFEERYANGGDKMGSSFDFGEWCMYCK
jgi:hypothetical protein